MKKIIRKKKVTKGPLTFSSQKTETGYVYVACDRENGD